MKPVLEAKRINKYFREPVLYHVLSDITFSIDKGEFVSVMGKSGCGKSTLLYILSTMDTDYEGELALIGQNVTGQSNRELSRIRNCHIGFVFQFHYLLPEFTVLDNVLLPARKLARNSKEEMEHQAMEKLGILGVDKISGKLASRISGGEKQRVAIARALINNPDILMCDEPTGNLDSQNAGIVFDLFRRLSSEQKISLLVVTHDQDFADKTDRILRMEDGKIIR